MARTGYWNHNVHYQSIILGAVPPGCGPALDVGCGDGVLAGRLAESSAEVTGIDRDRRMIALARAQAGDHTRVRFIEADFLAHDFPPASFDFVCANTSLHHMDFAGALIAMARALRPGGGLAVVGLAADRSFGDYLASASGIPLNLVYRALYREGNSGAPIQEPRDDLGRGPDRGPRPTPRRAVPPAPPVALLAALAQVARLNPSRAVTSA
jgi:SAM-dependent methyltransferase